MNFTPKVDNCEYVQSLVNIYNPWINFVKNKREIHAADGTKFLKKLRLPVTIP